MKKTGEILRTAREGKKLSIHEIGLSLKISSKVLRAIEEGDESQLPAKTFLRGFVQSYANYLGLQVDQVLDVFYEEMGSTKPRPYIRPADSATTSDSAVSQEENKAYSDQVTPSRLGQSKDVRSLNQGSSKKTIAVFIFSALLVGLILFTKKMIDKYSKEAEVPQGEVAQTIEGVTPLTSETPSVTENIMPQENMSVDPDSKATEESQASTPASPSPIAEPPAKPTPIVTPTTSPSPSPSTVPANTAIPSVSPTIAPSPTPSIAPATPTPTATTSIGKPVELIVEALDVVDVEYSAPNGKVQKIRLSAEQVHTFKSRSGLSIQFSNGGAINLILNGKDLGIPGDLGKSIKLSY